MTPRIETINPSRYGEYADIDPSFEIRSVLRVQPVEGGLGGIHLEEVPVTAPYRKGKDSPEDCPLHWPPNGETGMFSAFLAMDNDLPVGGAAVVTDPAGAFLFERRGSLAGLIDIRVRPEYRGRGVGGHLLRHAADWARQQGCSQLRIECQNTNVPACLFYAAHGTLGGIERHGYAACPDAAEETMLLWYIPLV